MAVQGNSHSVIKLMLQCGAKQDLVDDKLEGVLHVAGGLANIETMEILTKGLCCLDTEKVDIFGCTPLEVFDVQRATYTPEDDSTRARSRAAFLTLLSGIKPHSEDHYCWANKLVTLDEKNDYHDPDFSSTCSTMDEHFFDAESVLEDLSNETPAFHDANVQC